MTAGRLAKIKARVAVEEIKAKHWDGEEHHIGCGYGSSVCPGHPCWGFGRADFPDLITCLERAVDILREMDDIFVPTVVIQLLRERFLEEFDHDK